MNKKNFVNFLKKRNLTDEKILESVKRVEKMERFFKNENYIISNVSQEVVEKYIEKLIITKENSKDHLITLARIFYLEERKDIYIYFTKIFGGLEVIQNIKNRMEKIVGENLTKEIFFNLKEPTLGSKFTSFPLFTNELMKRIEKNITPELLPKILAGNNHGLTSESQNAEQIFFKNSKSLDEYLKERHNRKVEELQKFANSGDVWFEQIISQNTVDYVKSNQEILSAVRKGDKLYVTKIPYDTDKFLNTEDPILKKYYACHCPFARESILEKKEVPFNWCYCSAGFGKYPFEQILEKKLDVKLLNSALKGDFFCRFEIDLGNYIEK
jgi:hypothetical protein